MSSVLVKNANINAWSVSALNFLISSNAFFWVENISSM